MHLSVNVSVESCFKRMLLLFCIFFLSRGNSNVIWNFKIASQWIKFSNWPWILMPVHWPWCTEKLSNIQGQIDHLRNRLNFDLDKNFITAWKSITKLVIFQSFVAKCCTENADNIALRSLQFSVILDYKREIDSPIRFEAVNFPFVI